MTHKEIATEAASMLYKQITALLTRTRKACKTQLFHDVCYIFAGWNQHDVDVDQSSLKISWDVPRETGINYLDTLPRAKVLRPKDRASMPRNEMTQLDLENTTHLQQLILKHSEFNLLIEHDVKVNGSTCLLRYRTNLIEVACNLLSAYANIEAAAKAKDALSLDKYCFKAIIALAFGLRRLMSKAIEDLNIKKAVLWRSKICVKDSRGRPRRTRSSSANTGNNSALRYKFEVIDGMRLERLLPAPSKQKEVLNNMVLNLTMEEYNVKLQTVGVVNGSQNGALESALDIHEHSGQRIEENEREGVFGL